MNTKNLVPLAVLSILPFAAFAQTNIFPPSGNVGIGTTTPFISAALEVKSTTQGVLISRMTKAQRDAILVSSAAKGLLIYQTNNSPGFYYYNGTAWVAISGSGAGANQNLSNLLETTQVNSSLIPIKDDSLNIGSKNSRWKNIFLDDLKFSDNTSQNTAFIPYTAGSGIGINGNTITNTRKSQWTTNGSTIFYNTGNIGIGTSNPLQKLHVSGNINIDSGAALYISNKKFIHSGGYQNFFAGEDAGTKSKGGFNTASGCQSLYSNTTGSYNTASGYQSLYSDTSGYFNTASGYRAMYSNTSGFINTASGREALKDNTSGYGNSAFGNQALSFNTTGTGNTGMGTDAISSNTTGSGNTGLGTDANVSSVDLNNATVIGYQAMVDASNKVRIGNTGVTKIGGQVSWSTFSDGRYKKNIKEDVKGLAFINSLRPITYSVDINSLNEYYNKGRKHDSAYEQTKALMRPSTDLAAKIVYNGFIAQDVEAAAKKLNYEFSGVDRPETKDGLYGLRYADFVVPLVKAVQELSKMNDAKDARIATQDKKIDAQQKQIDELKMLVLSIQQNQQRCDPCAVSVASPSKSNKAIISDAASLEQNIPNPFAHTTTIGYTLPKRFNQAQIIITDKTGKALKKINISSAGKGTITVDLAVLASGAYNYSLIVDGKLIGTRQMVLVK